MIWKKGAEKYTKAAAISLEENCEKVVIEGRIRNIEREIGDSTEIDRVEGLYSIGA